MSADRAGLAVILTESLHLTLPPIGVAFADALPEGVPPFRGRVAAGCRFWQEAATDIFATTASDHAMCGIGTYTHNLAAGADHEAERGAALKVFADLGYVRAEDLPSIPVMKRRAQHVIYGPLARMPIAPDVVLLFVRADQSLVLSEASQQVEGGLPPAMGRPACAVIPQAAEGGRTALSLGCCGARAYLDTLTADVALYAIPGTRLEAFTGRVAALGRANMILSAFHQIRRRDVEAGLSPTIAQSLAAMSRPR